MPSEADLTPRQRRRFVTRALLRSAVTSVVLLVVYYLLPLDQELDATLAVEFTLGLVLLALTTAWELRQVIRSENPRLRAIQGIALGIPMFLLLFAATYVVIATNLRGSFTEPLTRTDSLYFTITVFTTVGFGDIAPVSQPARIVTTIQMLVGLALVGLVAKVMLGAVQEGMRRRTRTQPDGSPPPVTPTDGE